MDFELDKQTIRDLEIFGAEKNSSSIYGLYNYTKTIGGRKFLYGLMHSPLTDIQQIIQRSTIIKFFFEVDFDLAIHAGQFDFIDRYLNLNVAVLRNNIVDAYFSFISDRLKPKNDYYLIQSGIRQLIFLFRQLKDKFAENSGIKFPEELNGQVQYIESFLKLPDMKVIPFVKEPFSCIRLNKFDHLLRKKYKKEVSEIVRIVYMVDAYISVAKAAKKHHFSFPEYLTGSDPKLKVKGLFHPLIENAVPYDVNIEEQKNLCFLTGPNMAGKSTFLKTIGLSVYISHLGFPVPAKQMQTTIYNGIITTINLPDNINWGYSHFYSEVKRVKETALKIRENGNLLVIFDELFRGTNVKDAFDASLMIIKSFAKIKNCTFYISTHLTEIAEELKSMANIQFMYFDTELVDDTPQYSYQLMNGISHERLGLLILKNEKIIDILNSVSEAE